MNETSTHRWPIPHHAKWQRMNQGTRLVQYLALALLALGHMTWLAQAGGTRSSAAALAWAWALGWAVLLVAGAWSLHHAMAARVARLSAAVQHLGRGDLATQAPSLGRDEWGELGGEMERAVEALSGLVADIRSSASRVGMSGQELVHSNDVLSERARTQAADLAQAAGTVAHLSAAVARSAESAHELDALTRGLSQLASQGGRAMEDAAASMRELEHGSHRVGEIVGVIDGIAFQTNILALNAAVEAARAGEQGRGFAVVATEVRQLAQRSSAAAAEIRTLLAQSARQVHISGEHTRQVGAALTALVDGVQRVSSRLRDMAQASTEQSSKLTETSQRMANLDALTQDSLKMASASHQAAQDLVQHTLALDQAVHRIRLRQGTADEARALVHRAHQLVRSKGLRGAWAELHARESGFVDRDLYVWVVNRRGEYVLHGANAAAEGRRVHTIPGIDGERFVRDLFALPPEGGWVQYDIRNAATGAVQAKASYALALDADRHLGCGIYRSTAQALT